MVMHARKHPFRGVVVAAVLASALVASVADRTSAQHASAADEAAIAEFNRRYLKAINDGDIDTLAMIAGPIHQARAAFAEGRQQFEPAVIHDLAELGRPQLDHRHLADPSTLLLASSLVPVSLTL